MSQPPAVNVMLPMKRDDPCRFRQVQRMGERGAVRQPPRPHRAVPRVAAADDDRGAIRQPPDSHSPHSAVVAGEDLVKGAHLTDPVQLHRPRGSRARHHELPQHPVQRPLGQRVTERLPPCAAVAQRAIPAPARAAQPSRSSPRSSTATSTPALAGPSRERDAVALPGCLPSSRAGNSSSTCSTGTLAPVPESRRSSTCAVVSRYRRSTTIADPGAAPVDEHRCGRPRHPSLAPGRHPSPGPVRFQARWPTPSSQPTSR